MIDEARESNKTFRLKAGIILLLVLVVYIPAVKGDFVWDDDWLLTDNSYIRSRGGLYRIWFTTEAPDYYPVTWTSFWFEWRLWHMNPAGYHVTNMLLHAVGSVLIWLVLKRLKIPGAWLAGIIFAVHPVNVTSVAWISERKNTLSIVFYLLTILSYLRFEHDRRQSWYAFSAGMFLLALLSKASVVMLPFVLLGCAWWQRDKIDRKDLIRTVPFFALSAIFGLITMWFQHYRAMKGGIVRSEGFLFRVASAGWAVWFYLYNAISPFKLCAIYPRWDIDHTSVISFLPGGLLIGCAIVAWRYRRSWGRPLLFGIGYFVVTILPLLGFVDMAPLKFTLVADRWQYLPLIGVVSLLAGAGTYLRDRLHGKWDNVTAAVAVILLSVLCVLTWRRAGLYRDREMLWRDNLAKNPTCWMTHNNLGVALFGREKRLEAMAHYKRAIELNPYHVRTHYNMGLLLEKQGQTKDAIACYETALRLGGGRGLYRVHNNLGGILFNDGLLEESIEHYSKALRHNPEFAETHYNMGLALGHQKKWEAALVHLAEAVRLKPDFAEAHDDLAKVLVKIGQTEAAAAHFREAARLNPDL